MSFLLAGLFISYYKSFNRSEKIFGFFLLLNLIFEMIAWSSTHVFEIKNNLPGLHAYTLLEFIFIAYFANKTIDRIKRKYQPIIFIVGIFFIIYNSAWIQSIYTYNSISISVVKIFTILVSILFFYQVLAKRKYDIIEIRPSVYFFTGIFLNACISMIWYMYSNKIILLTGKLRLQLNVLKHTTTVLASLIILTGIIYIINRKKEDTT